MDTSAHRHSQHPSGAIYGLPVAPIEQIVAVLRMATIALFIIGDRVVKGPETSGFHVILVAYGCWSLGALFLALKAPSVRAGWTATVVDIAAITALIAATAGPVSYARYAYFLVPVTVAFRFTPPLTALATVATAGTYLLQAVYDDSQELPGLESAYIALVGIACTGLSWVLRRYVAHVVSLADARTRLLADVLEAEDRERQALAESLHDHPIQNLLAARHALEGAAREHGESDRHQTVAEALTATISDLRESVFQMHPYVLDEAGLDTALRRTAAHLQARTGLVAEVTGSTGERVQHSRLLFGVARELLTNVAKHAQANAVRVELSRSAEAVTLRVIDDGAGFDPAELPERLADGHIGLASQRVRIETIGGRLEVESRSGEGTTVHVVVPV